MLHCSLQVSVPNRYWWLHQGSLARDKPCWIVELLSRLGAAQQDSLPAALLRGIYKWHIFSLSSSEDIPYQGLEKLQIPYNPQAKNGLQSNFPFQGDQKNHPHTHPHVPWIAHEPSASFQRALLSSGNAINYFRTEAGEHPSPRVYSGSIINRPTKHEAVPIQCLWKKSL